MKNDIVELKCVDISVDGQGICKDDNGYVVFVKGMLPDETAKVKIISEKKNCAFGIIDSLIKKSKYRIEPICPISYKCGGCDYHYVDYHYQLELKKKVLESTFANMSLNVKVHDVAAADEQLYYRNKVQVPCKDDKFGFYRNYSNDIVEFDTCYIQTKLSNDILNDLKVIIRKYKIQSYIRHIIIKHARGTNEVMIGLVVKDFKVPSINDVVKEITNKNKSIKSIILNLNDADTNVILGDKEMLVYGNDYITDEFDGLKFNISLKSFYQVNYYQMHKLYKLARYFGDVDSNSRVLDLYCGIGTITLFMAKRAKEVVGVEIVKEAIENAKQNAKLNNMNNVSFYVGDARKSISDYLKDKDVLVVDPPRKGLSEQSIADIIDSKIKTIIYISCNPATLARDLTHFEKDYTIGEINPVDMFPYTTHIECVVVMKRKDK